MVAAFLSPVSPLACRKAADPGTSTGGAPGDVVPAVTVNDLSGKKLDLSSTRGKVLLINFWATWCAPCRHEIPDIARLYEKYRPQGLEVLGLVVDSGTASDIQPYVGELGITYPVYLADDVRDQFYREPGVPMTILVNRKGVIVSKLLGMQSREELENAITPLLKEGA